MPELDHVQKRQQAQGQCYQRQDGLREEQDGTAVVPVGNQSAHQGESQDSHEANAADNAHSNWIFAQLADVPEQHPLLHLRTHHGDDQANPDQGKPAMFESRRKMEHSCSVFRNK